MFSYEIFENFTASDFIYLVFLGSMLAGSLTSIIWTTINHFVFNEHDEEKKDK